MCGIAGKVSIDVPAGDALLGRMCAVVRHRGPDSRGSFVEPPAALGVQRLAVIDLDTGDQPVFNEDESVVIVMNGEIYNYRELRARLREAGHRFRSEGDTEVIVHLYEEHGDACVDHLRGMFAFALWDRRRQRLLVARDRIGKKPLFYGVRNGSLWFASEPKSILQDPSVPRDFDLAAIDHYLHYGYVPEQQSAFSALRKLPPAHALTWEAGRAETRRYWKLSFEPKLERPEAELRELVRDQLVEATRLRMRSDVPLGAFLSGGVDSSGVVAAMAHAGASRIKTFSIGFGHEEFDERPFAREVAELFGTEHHELVVEPDAMELLPDLAWHYGEPFADHSAIPSFYLARLTRERVTVALNGDGGDESFAGYNRYIGMSAASRIRTRPPALARGALRALGPLGTGSRQDSLRSRAKRLLRAASLPPGEAYAEWMAWFSADDRRRLYREDALAEVDLSAPGRALSAPYAESDARAALDRVLDVDTQTYLPGDLLVKMDIASMASSLEVRSPMLDHVFMEMAARLPASTKLGGRQTKRMLKDSLRPWIPDHLLDRQKRGFSVPLREWLRHELHELPATILLDPGALGRGIFRESEVRRLISDHHASRRDNANKLWALIQLELWFRTYLDSPAAGPIPIGLK